MKLQIAVLMTFTFMLPLAALAQNTVTVNGKTYTSSTGALSVESDENGDVRVDRSTEHADKKIGEMRARMKARMDKAFSRNHLDDDDLDVADSFPPVPKSYSSRTSSSNKVCVNGVCSECDGKLTVMNGVSHCDPRANRAESYSYKSSGPSPSDALDEPSASR